MLSELAPTDYHPNRMRRIAPAGSGRLQNRIGITPRGLSLVSLIGLTVLLTAACKVRETHPRCESDDDCASGQSCYRRFCVIAQPEEASPSEPDVPDAAASGSVVSDRSAANDADGGRHSSTTDAEEPCKRPDSPEVDAVEGACCEAPVPCYEGPAETRDVGVCKAGMRACVDGRLGPCQGSTTPRSETCDNEGSDDDCDGDPDDVEGRETSCVLASWLAANSCDGQGAWRCVKGMRSLACVALRPRGGESCNRQDDDCDSKIDEDFDLTKDHANCGACGVSCNAQELCCAGACVARDKTTGNGCPMCDKTNQCVNATTCCDGSCRDLKTDRAHCGACGVACRDGQMCCNGMCGTGACR
jgi:hypothetical protein